MYQKLANGAVVTTAYVRDDATATASPEGMLAADAGTSTISLRVKLRVEPG